ncbi:MAG: hypothetical protein ACPL28_06765 [bacterium]
MLKIKILLLLSMTTAVFAQHSERDFVLRLWSMGNLSLILEDPETALNMFAFNENPIDLIDYCPGNRLLQFINRVDYQNYEYMGKLCYANPKIRYLEKVTEDLGIGLVLSSRLLPPPELSYSTSSKYNFLILSNLRTGKFYFGYATRIKMLPYQFYYKIEQEPGISLNLSNVKLGISYNLQYRDKIHQSYENSFFDVPIYFLYNLRGIKELFTYRYYSKRHVWLFFESAYGYDVTNILVYGAHLDANKFQVGLDLNYRQLYELEYDGGSSISKLVNIAPGFSFDTKTFTLSGEFPIRNSFSKKGGWFCRQKLGLELKMNKKLAVQLGWAKIEATEILPEDWFVFYDIPLFPYPTYPPGNCYTLGFTSLISQNFKFESSFSLNYFPDDGVTVIQNISFRWQF